MNAKECRFCRHCDINRTNDIGQVRCTRFSTFVNLFNCCDYFTTNKMNKFAEVFDKSMLRRTGKL